MVLILVMLNLFMMIVEIGGIFIHQMVSHACYSTVTVASIVAANEEEEREEREEREKREGLVAAETKVGAQPDP